MINKRRACEEKAPITEHFSTRAITRKVAHSIINMAVIYQFKFSFWGHVG